MVDMLLSLILTVFFFLSIVGCFKDKNTNERMPSKTLDRENVVVLTKDLCREERRTEPMGKTPLKENVPENVLLAKSEADPNTLKNVKSLAPDLSKSIKQ